MKTTNLNQNLIKVKNRLNQDIMYTSPDWPTKEIDGVTFLAVKFRANDTFPKLMRKDSFEKIK
jgi:hypothetical protein